MPHNPFTQPDFWYVATRVAAVLLVGLLGVVIAERKRLADLSSTTLFLRVRSWAIIAPVFVLALYAGGLLVFLLAAFVALQGAAEYGRLVGLHRRYAWFLRLWILVGLLVAALARDFFLFLPLGFFFLLTLVPIITGDVEGAHYQVSGTLFSYLYVGLPMAYLVYIKAAQPWGREFLMVVGLAVALADVCAFIVGSALRGPKLAPRVSPNKTWSGVLGSLIGASLGLLLARLIPDDWTLDAAPRLRRHPGPGRLAAVRHPAGLLHATRDELAGSVRELKGQWMSETDLREVVRNLMPALRRDLTDLVRIESVNAPTTISEVTKTREAIIDLFRTAGITQAQELVLQHEGRKTTPLVYADHPGPPGAPVVLLYAHYDVQPGGGGWTVTEPFMPLERDVDGDTRLYGRGAADDKSGVCLHLAAVRASTALPVHLKLVIEGEEEVGAGVLEDYLRANPTDDRFKADLIVVADTGNVRVGEPTLTTSLRGLVAVDVTVSTLERPVHSGMYGGPAPDAFMALTRMLATLHDDAGDVAVAGLSQDTLGWPMVSEAQFRADAGVLPGVALIGTEPIEERLYGRPSINVVGLDGVPPMSKATNALRPMATARVSMRLAPSQDPDAARTLLVNHLRQATPWGVTVEITPVGEGFGFSAQTGSTYFTAAQNAIRTAYQADTVAHAGQGGSIPLVHAFQVVNPEAAIVLWGCEEPRAAIHGPNESVSYRELESMALTEALLLQEISNEG